MILSIPDYILSLKPYVPGKPLEELERELGITDSIKLASNENPLGPSPKAIEAIESALKNLHRYPDGSGYCLVNALADHLNVSPLNIVLGNGSDEIIDMLTSALLQPGDEAIMPQPSFLMYDILVRCQGAKPVYSPLNSLAIDLEDMAARITPATRIVFLTNPMNPTGSIIKQSDFDRFLAKTPPEVVIIMDEAYIEFVRDASCVNGLQYAKTERAMVTMRTFSKAYGLAGLRIGYGVMPETIANILNRIRLPFNMNSLAQTAACAALADTEFLSRTIRLVHQELDFMYDALDKKGIRYFPTQANFFLIDVGKSADMVFEDMLKHGIIIRSMSSYGYPRYIRVNIGRHEENVRFLDALDKVL